MLVLNCSLDSQPFTLIHLTTLYCSASCNPVLEHTKNGKEALFFAISLFKNLILLHVGFIFFLQL